MPDPLHQRLRRTRRAVVLLLFLTLGAFAYTALAGTLPEESPAKQKCACTAASADPAKSDAKLAESDAKLLIASLFILVLAGFVGFEVIGGVSPLLHTPLMSVTNAISAISVVGALVIAGSAGYKDPLSRWLGFFAVAAAMTNVVGGFMITDRMLRLFKSKGTRA